MGAKESKAEGPAHLQRFSAEEYESIKTRFGKASEGKPECQSDCVKTLWAGLVEGDLLQNILITLSTGKHQTASGDAHATITFADFAELGSSMLKGTVDERVDVICTLADGNADKDNVNTQEMIQYVRSMVESYLRCESSSAAYKSWKPSHSQASAANRENLSLHILHDLIFKGKAPKDTLYSECEITPFTQEDIHSWLVKCPLMSILQSHVFSRMYRLPAQHDSLLPRAIGLPTEPFPSVLDYPSVIFLNSSLPAELRKEWRFLFSTRLHGESFSKLLGQATNRGPTILVIVDKNRHIFGGFASYSWCLGPKFVGSSDSFLFNLSPKMAMYGSTTYNSHYMYMNVQQQTLPNGLGMGGQLEYFGLWLDAEFGHGRCSPTCTTFQSPQLSARPEFEVKHLEVWGVGPEPEAEVGERKTVSALDQDLEAQAILDMVGRGAVSQREDRTSDPED